MRNAGADLRKPPSPAGEKPQRLRGAAAHPSTVHIDRLILEGVGLHPRDAPRLQRALASELSRLMTRTAAPQKWQGGTALAATPVLGLMWPGAASPEQGGQALALALHRGLRGEPVR